MRLVKILAIVCGSTLFLACTQLGQEFAKPEFSTKTLEYDPPLAQSFQLDNGLRVLFIPDPELPLIAGVLYTKPGSLVLDRQQQTLAAATGTLMRTGGAGSRNARELDEAIQNLSASVSASIGGEFSSFGFSGLSSDREALFELLADIIQRPRFQQDRLDLWKSQSLDDIKRRIEDPATIAQIAFDQLLYSDSVFGQVTTSADVQAITTSAMRRLHESLVRPDQAIFAVTGAIEISELTRLVKRYFTNWQPRGHTLSEPSNAIAEPTPGIYLVERPLEQTTIQMGQLGIKRLSPDHLPAIVFNQILSSGMTGRLMDKLRVELGLVYSAYGAVVPGVVRGANLIGAQTKSLSTVKAIDEAITILDQLASNSVNASELHDTKQYIKNTFIFRFADNAALVNRYAVLDLLDYPEDYDLTYLDKIAAVSATDLQNMTARLWDPSKFVIVVVGSSEACRLVEEASKFNSGSQLAGMKVTRAKFIEKLEF